MLQILKDAFSNVWQGQSLVRSFLQCPQSWPALCKGGLENTLRDLLLGPLQSEPGLAQLMLTGERRTFDLAVYCPPSTHNPPNLFWNNPRAVIEFKFNFTTQVREVRRLDDAFGRLRKKIGVNIPLCGIHFVCCVNADADDNVTNTVL